MTDELYMRQALDLARQAADEGDIPVGAIVVSPDGRVIGTGRNRRRIEHDPTAHAEVVAIRQAANELQAWNLSRCSLYVTLEPCPMCAGAIMQSRLSRLVYGCTDPKAGCCGTLLDITGDRRFPQRITVVSGVLETECRGILQDFFIKCRANARKNQALQKNEPVL